MDLIGIKFLVLTNILDVTKHICSLQVSWITNIFRMGADFIFLPENWISLIFLRHSNLQLLQASSCTAVGCAGHTNKQLLVLLKGQLHLPHVPEACQKEGFTAWEWDSGLVVSCL